MKSGKTIAWLLLIGGAVLAAVGVLWIGANVASGRLRVTGALFGGGLLAVAVLPLLGAGVFLLVRTAQEGHEAQKREVLRRILDIVKSRGEVPISDLVLELGSTRDVVQQQVHALVGMGLFSGYINWDDGVLYSQDASSLRELDRCKRCGGELKLAGKGVIVCHYCGTEYFLN